MGPTHQGPRQLKAPGRRRQEKEKAPSHLNGGRCLVRALRLQIVLPAHLRPPACRLPTTTCPLSALSLSSSPTFAHCAAAMPRPACQPQNERRDKTFFLPVKMSVCRGSHARPPEIYRE